MPIQRLLSVFRKSCCFNFLRTGPSCSTVRGCSLSSPANISCLVSLSTAIFFPNLRPNLNISHPICATVPTRNHWTDLQPQLQDPPWCWQPRASMSGNATNRQRCGQPLSNCSRTQTAAGMGCQMKCPSIAVSKSWVGRAVPALQTADALETLSLECGGWSATRLLQQQDATPFHRKARALNDPTQMLLDPGN